MSDDFKSGKKLLLEMSNFQFSSSEQKMNSYLACDEQYGGNQRKEKGKIQQEEIN